MENHLECWKQFNHFVNLARAKKFGNEDAPAFVNGILDEIAAVVEGK